MDATKTLCTTMKASKEGRAPVGEIVRSRGPSLHPGPANPGSLSKSHPNYTAGQRRLWWELRSPNGNSISEFCGGGMTAEASRWTHFNFIRRFPALRLFQKIYLWTSPFSWPLPPRSRSPYSPVPLPRSPRLSSVGVPALTARAPSLVWGPWERCERQGIVMFPFESCHFNL